MTYIENIYICIVLPLLLSLFFTDGKARTNTVFILIGMTVCYLSAYVNSFFSAFYMTDAVTAAVEISPVCEEIMKLIPLLMYVVIFEPKRRDIPAAAIAVSVGFATFENVCFLTENGAENFFFLLARGMSAGALHILCGIVFGGGIAYVFGHDWLMLTGSVGILGISIVFHALYNLMITSDGVFRQIGYVFPSVLIVLLFILKCVAEKSGFKIKTE